MVGAHRTLAFLVIAVCALASGLSFVAVTMPLATSSVRVMPPKMLNRMAFTFGSLVMMRSAFTTFSGFDEPPMSRKFAGSPP